MKNLLASLTFFFVCALSYTQCSFTVTEYFNSPTCYGYSDGAITLSVSGATGAIFYEISDSSGNVLNNMSNTANQLYHGWYYYSVTDESPCTETDSIFLQQPDEMQIIWDSFTDVSCNGAATGYAAVDTVLNAQGNFVNITYFWYPPGTGGSGPGASTQSDLTANNYTLTIYDDQGCSYQDSFAISEPPALSWSNFSSSPDSCSGSQTGVVSMAASGGTPGYFYQWTNLQNMSTSMSTTLGGLGAGCYEGQVTDNNGCTLTDTICVGCLTLPEPEIKWEIYPNPSEGDFVVNSDHNGSAKLKVYSSAGSLIYEEDINHSSTTISLDDVRPGVYWILFETSEGTARRKIILN